MKRAIVFLVLVLWIVVCTAESASAFVGPSWVNGAASMSQNIPVVANVRGECAGIIQERYIVELGVTSKICFFGDDRIKFGYFSSGGYYVGAVQFSKSEEVHVVEGVCNGVTCRYSAENDMLVTQQSVAGGHRGVAVYLRASERVKRVSVPGNADKYVFDTSQPDYAVKNKEGQYLVTPSYAVSRNGEWIAIELRNAGIAVIDTKTFDARQLITNGYMYGYGMDPSLQLAISNDGNKVAVTGQNAGLKVIERISGCGQTLVGDLSRQADSFSCLSSDLSIGVRFPNFHSTEHPRFSGDGYQLEMIVNSWVDGSRIVTFIANGAKSVPKLKLLAFGDSFTSGEGEENESFYRKGTNEGIDVCHVSDRSYPMLIARAVGYSSVDANTVACAGATTGDIYGATNAYWGQGNRLGENGQRLTSAQRSEIQEVAIHSFQPGHVLQSAFLERYTPEKLLIGIGGNDAGLMGKLRACVMPDTCEWVSDEGLRSTADEIKRLYAALSEVFTHINQLSPGTKIFVVGYPNIIDANGSCDPVTNLLLNQKERIFIERSIEYMNKVIRAAAKKAEFTYLDVERSMNGKRLCNSGPLGMNGLRLGDDISISGTFPMLKIIGSETFHPTPLGHDLVAKAILAANPSLQPESVCATDPMACIPSVLDIEPPSYWDVSSSLNTASYASTFATQATNDEYMYQIAIPANTLEPGSMARIEMRSDVVTLDTVTVNQDGGYSGTVTVPRSTIHGFHTLHMLGQNRSGESIDIYQDVTVGKFEDTTRSDKDSSQTLPVLLGGDTNSGGNTPGFMEVLGDQVALASRTDMLPGSQNVRPSEYTQKEDFKIVKMNAIPVIVIGVIVACIVAALLLRRRWAKQSS